MSQAAATVDLRGNNSDLKSVLADSERNFTGFGSKLTTIFTGITAGLNIAGVMKNAIGSLAGVVEGFIAGAEKAEESEKRLAGVIRATGGAAGYSKDQLVEFADHLESVTKAQSETIQGAMSVIATFKNIRGDTFLQATEAAQDMAAVLDTDVKGAALQVAKALNDPVQGINALRRAGVSFTGAQVDMINSLIKSGDVIKAQSIILDELKSEFGGVAKEMGSGFSGQLEILKNRIGITTDVIGNKFIEVFKEMGPVIETAVSAFEDMLPVILDCIDIFVSLGRNIIEALKPAFEFLVTASASALAVVMTVFNNFGDSVALVGNVLAYSLVKSWNELVYYLTEVLPTSVKWFADNFVNIFTDMATANYSILKNMAMNIYDFIVAIKSYLSGGEFDFKFTALLDGFESTLSEFPKIAERQIGGVEAILQAEVDRLGGKLGQEAITRFQDIKNRLTMGAHADERTKRPELESNADLNFDSEGFKTKKDKAAPKEKTEAKSGAVGLEELNAKISGASGEAEKRAEKQKENRDREKQIEVAERTESSVDDVDESLDEVTKSIEDLEAPINESREQAKEYGEAMKEAGKSVQSIQKQQFDATVAAIQLARDTKDVLSKSLEYHRETAGTLATVSSNLRDMLNEAISIRTNTAKLVSKDTTATLG